MTIGRLARFSRTVLAALSAVLPVLFGATVSAQGAVRIAYADWSSSVASAHVVCAVLEERLDRRCELQRLPADEMWAAVADGRADAMLSAWLPDTHRHYLERYAARLVDLGPNLEGTRTGLVVPAVAAGRQTGATGMRGRRDVAVESIADLREKQQAFGGRIVGIDPEAGIMRAAERALEAYDLAGWRLVEGSEAQMTAALTQAVRRQEPIVVTGWVPHWMFGRWALRMLEDPKGVFGDTGAIHTMVRPGLGKERPEVQRFLDRFRWEPRDMEQLMLWIEIDRGLDPYGKARRWLAANPDKVETWIVADD